MFHMTRATAPIFGGVSGGAIGYRDAAAKHPELRL
jgi:hypothetical protein